MSKLIFNKNCTNITLRDAIIILEKYTGIPWGYSRTKSRIRYVSSNEWPILINVPLRKKKFYSRISYKIHIELLTSRQQPDYRQNLTYEILSKLHKLIESAPVEVQKRLKRIEIAGVSSEIGEYSTLPDPYYLELMEVGNE